MLHYDILKYNGGYGDILSNKYIQVQVQKISHPHTLNGIKIFLIAPATHHLVFLFPNISAQLTFQMPCLPPSHLLPSSSY